MKLEKSISNEQLLNGAEWSDGIWQKFTFWDRISLIMSFWN
jgi:hypothetical protein